MKNEFPPLDNSISTQLKYNLFVEKLSEGQRNYNIHNQTSTSNAFIVGVGIFQIILGLVGLLFGILRWIFLRLK